MNPPPRKRKTAYSSLRRIARSLGLPLTVGKAKVAKAPATPAPTVDETERLREALAFVGHQATCINGHSHYCPNCDRTLHEIGDTVNAALSDRPQAEGEVNRG